MNNINLGRFKSKREKDGSSHKRAKSKEISSEKKVMFLGAVVLFIIHPYKLIRAKQLSFSVSNSSIPVALSWPNSKTVQHCQTTFSTIQINSTDPRPCLFLQIRGTSSHGDGMFASIFRTDPQKKVEKDQELQVGIC